MSSRAISRSVVPMLPFVVTGLFEPRERLGNDNLKRQNLASKAPTKGVMLLSRWQVAEKLSVSVDTVKRMEKRQQLKPIRLNARMIRYRLHEVEAMMKAHETEATK